MFTPSYNITEWFSVKVASKEIQGPSEKGSGLCARKSTGHGKSWKEPGWVPMEADC